MDSYDRLSDEVAFSIPNVRLGMDCILMERPHEISRPLRLGIYEVCGFLAMVQTHRMELCGQSCYHLCNNTHSCYVELIYAIIKSN